MNEEKIKEILEENAKLKEELEATKGVKKHVTTYVTKKTRASPIDCFLIKMINSSADFNASKFLVSGIRIRIL